MLFIKFKSKNRSEVGYIYILCIRLKKSFNRNEIVKNLKIREAPPPQIYIPKTVLESLFHMYTKYKIVIDLLQITDRNLAISNFIFYCDRDGQQIFFTFLV